MVESAIEPGAPSLSPRPNALEEISNAGVPVYVSMSPTYPLMDEYQIDNLLGHSRALGDDIVVFHEPINPREENFEMLKAAMKELDRPELFRPSSVTSIRYSV